MARLLFLQNIDYEFLGPMYISSMVKKHGHECELSIGQTLNDFKESLEKFKPDLVAFSIMSGSHSWARGMARQVKKQFSIPNIFGGAHPTFFPEFQSPRICQQWWHALLRMKAYSLNLVFKVKLNSVSHKNN